MDYTQDLNLCNEVVKELIKIGVNETFINNFKTTELFISAYDKSPHVQKTILTMLFYKLIMYSNLKVDKNIRIALADKTEINSWLDDVKLVLIPFIRFNGATFNETFTFSFNS